MTKETQAERTEDKATMPTAEGPKPPKEEIVMGAWLAGVDSALDIARDIEGRIQNCKPGTMQFKAEVLRCLKQLRVAIYALRTAVHRPATVVMPVDPDAAKSVEDDAAAVEADAVEHDRR